MEESIGLLEQVKQRFPFKEEDIRAYSPLALAFLGDSVYDVIIRTVVVGKCNRPAHQLHRDAVRFVNAKTQAEMAEVLTDEFTPEELAVFKRGRNAKSATSAKNASIQDYRKATGFETLLGFLYLSGRQDRVLELIQSGFDRLELKI